MIILSEKTACGCSDKNAIVAVNPWVDTAFSMSPVKGHTKNAQVQIMSTMNAPVLRRNREEISVAMYSFSTVVFKKPWSESNHSLD